MRAKRSEPEEIERFRELVRTMTKSSAVYRMLKAELTALGRWRNLPRGKPRRLV